MAVRKFAISVAEEVMEQVDRAAARRQMTRSGFVAHVLREIARARSDAETTKRINRIMADPELAAEQKETADAFGALASRRGARW